MSNDRKAKLAMDASKVIAFAKANRAADGAMIARATGIPRANVDQIMLAVISHARAQKVARRVTLIPSPPVATATDFAPIEASQEGNGEFFSEWDQLVADQQATALNPDGSPANDLQQNAYFAQLQKQERNKEAPHVNELPSSITEMSVLGGQATLTSGQLAKEAVYWSGGNDEARTVTITLGRVPSIPAPGFPTAGPVTPVSYYYYSPFAVIRWGTRGYNHSAVVDVGRGNQITVSGSSVYVDLGMDPIITGAAITYVAGTMQLGATLGFNARQSIQPVTRTVAIGLLANNTLSNPVVIPDFAQTLTAYVNPVNGGALAGFSLIIVIRDASGAAAIYSQSYTAPSQIQPIVLSDDAYDVVVVQSNTSANAMPVRLIFGLAL